MAATGIISKQFIRVFEYGRFFLLICLPGLLTAQVTNSESRQMVYSSDLLKDTAVIIKQIQQANLIAESNTDSAILLADHALKSSNALKFKNGMVRSFYELGILYNIKNQHQRSISYFQAALPYSDTGKEGSTQNTKIYTAIAFRYLLTGNTDSSARYYYKALDEIERGKVDNPEVLINTYSRIIFLWLSMVDHPDTASVNKYIENATNYLNKAALLEQTNDKMLVKILTAKAQIFHLKRNPDSAIQYYKAYLSLAKKGNAGRQASGIVSANINIGQVFLMKDLPDSVIYYSKLALEAMAKDPHKDSAHWVIAGYNMAQAFLSQKKYQQAIDMAVPALKTSRNLPSSFQYTGHEILSKTYAAAGMYELAWQEQNEYSRMKDSLNRAENLQTISQMEVKYQLADRKKELAEKELAISKKNASIKAKNFMIGGIVVVFLVFIAIYLQQQRMRQYKLRKQTEIDRLNATINAVEQERSRIARELHDGIGGLLGSIGLQLGAAFKTHNIEDSSGDFKNIQQLVSDAYIELRQTSHNLMPETLRYEGLIRATEHFCKGVSRGGLLKINFESSGKIPPLPPDAQLAIYRIIQELIHNIIKHAKADEALVQLNVVNNQLSVTVEDNGIGMKTPPDENNDGMGLKTIRERVKMMKGILDISSAPGEGTSFNMVFFTTSENNAFEYDDKNSDNG